MYVGMGSLEGEFDILLCTWKYLEFSLTKGNEVQMILVWGVEKGSLYPSVHLEIFQI